MSQSSLQKQQELAAGTAGSQTWAGITIRVKTFQQHGWMLRRPKSNRALGDGRIEGDETLQGQCTAVESSSLLLYICCHQIKNTKFLFLYVRSLCSARVPPQLAHAIVPPLPALENKSLRKFVAPKYRLLVIKRFIWVGRTQQSVKQERRSGGAIRFVVPGGRKVYHKGYRQQYMCTEEGACTLNIKQKTLSQCGSTRRLFNFK